MKEVVRLLHSANKNLALIFNLFRFFQYTFACALSSIVAGTIAERTKMMAYLCYSIFLCGKSHGSWLGQLLVKYEKEILFYVIFYF